MDHLWSSLLRLAVAGAVGVGVTSVFGDGGAANTESNALVSKPDPPNEPG